MSVQIGAKPDSGFDDPLGMLKDCHRRIEHFLGILRLVAERATGLALHPEEISAVKAAVQYFHIGGERHNADEEQSVFSRLRNVAATGADLPALLDRLEQDHAHAAELHEAIDWLYTDWIAKGEIEPANRERLLSSTAALQDLYKEHIALEESTIFPRATELLDSQTLAAIGREFSARRA